MTDKNEKKTRAREPIIKTDPAKPAFAVISESEATRSVRIVQGDTPEKARAAANTIAAERAKATKRPALIFALAAVAEPPAETVTVRDLLASDAA